MIEEIFTTVKNTVIHSRFIRNSADTEQPVLVFLHEGLGCVEMWKTFPLELSQKAGLNALIYDRTGYGKSGKRKENRQKDDLHKEAWEILPHLLRQLRIHSPLLVGHSDGGTIALLYAAKFAHTKAVITEAAHVIVEEITLQGIRKTVDLYENDNLKQRLQKYHGKNTDNVFYNWANLWLSNEFANWTITADIETIRCPVLALQGADDEYGTIRQPDLICKHAGQQATQVIIEDCAHIPHFQAKEKTLTLMTDFIIKQLNTDNYT